MKIPYDKVEFSRERFPWVSLEELEILNKYKPVSLAAASQIQGMNPNTIVNIYEYIRKRKYLNPTKSQSMANGDLN
jgi:tRNA U34 5-carboxymethylaminomethyl modifying enzyme MnmG/GidA